MPSHGDLFHDSFVDLLQGDFNWDQLRLHLFGTVVLLLVIEKVKHIPATHSGRTSILDALFSIVIIKLSLLWINESLRGLLDPPEAFGVPSSIGMLFKCLFPEGFLDLLCGSLSGDIKHLVELGCIGWLSILRPFLARSLLSKEHINKTDLLSNYSRLGYINKMETRLRRKRSTQIHSASLPSRTPKTTLGSRVLVKEQEVPGWDIDRLSTNYIHPYLKGREEEKQVIRDFVEDSVMNRINNKVLYISGIPGIGKTASTMEVVGRVKLQFRRKLNSTLINALSLTKPEKVYQSLWNFVSGGKLGSYKKVSQLEEVVASLKKCHLIIIDEVDFLLTKSQQIFYNLFEWVSQVSSKLAFIMIANTMDFPQRLAPKVSSRMGNHRLVFAPYHFSQIRKILVERLEGCPYFSSSSLTFISKKLSSFSSDIRTILDILKRAITDHISSGKTEIISIDTLQKVWMQTTSKSLIEKRQEEKPVQLPEKIVELLKKKKGECSQIQILDVLRQQDGVGQNNLSALLKEMEEQGLINRKTGKQGMFICKNVRLADYLLQ